MKSEKTETDIDRMDWAVWWLVCYYGRFGCGARYRGWKQCEIPLYVAARLLKRYSPSFDPEEYIDPRFTKAAEPAMEDVDARIGAVEAEGEPLLVLIAEFVEEQDRKLRSGDRSDKWGRFVDVLSKITPPISRKAAFKIASEYLGSHPVAEIVGIGDVFLPGETSISPNIYDPRGENPLGKSWIAFGKRPKGYTTLGSDYVILVSKETGEVLMAGSACN